MYKNIKEYLTHKIIPNEIPSTKSNFKKICSKYSLNKKNQLIRDDKIVVIETQQHEIFDALHQHSGRTATWNRIKSR